MKYCVNLTNGQLFAWTEALAKKTDFVVYQHPLKHDLGPVVRHEPQKRLDDAPVRVPSTYQNAAPCHLLPFTSATERFPQFFHDRSNNTNELKWLFQTDVLADCLYVCGNAVYLGFAETTIALDKTKAPIEQYAEFHQQALHEATATLRDAPSRAVEGCTQRLALAQDRALEAQSVVDAIRSEAAGMDILGKDFKTPQLEELRRDHKRAAGKLDAETKRLQSAQADLDGASELLEAVERKQQASDDVPVFKAPGQKAECTRLNVSERHLRDLFDKFKTDYDIESLRWANLTKARYELFTQWMESQEAA